jgi:hypothetical protein
MKLNPEPWEDSNIRSSSKKQKKKPPPPQRINKCPSPPFCKAREPSLPYQSNNSNQNPAKPIFPRPQITHQRSSLRAERIDHRGWDHRGFPTSPAPSLSKAGRGDKLSSLPDTTTTTTTTPKSETVGTRVVSGETFKLPSIILPNTVPNSQ